jgi:hypothetical protein
METKQTKIFFRVKTINGDLCKIYVYAGQGESGIIYKVDKYILTEEPLKEIIIKKFKNKYLTHEVLILKHETFVMVCSIALEQGNYLLSNCKN